MDRPVTIASFEIENVKRVKAVSLVPSPTGLTVIGGRNGQGKTSVLDAIAWALGGNRMRPTSPARVGSATPPHIKVGLSNGLVVERSGKNSDLKVIDPAGNKAGQALLDGLIEELALDLPRFMRSTPKEKAQTLLEAVGVGEELFELQRQERELYDERTAVGRMRDSKQAAADEMPYYPDAPAGPVSASELIQQQQEILAKNGENQRLRDNVVSLEARRAALDAEIAAVEERLALVLADQEKKLGESIRLNNELITARMTARELHDESTAEIEASLALIEDINNQVRTNKAKLLAQGEADGYKADYMRLTGEVEAVRAAQAGLLEGAGLPLPGLSVKDGELAYEGFAWDGLSSTEQLKVATSIVGALKPDCGFVLIDKMEQMDRETLAEFGQWAAGQGLQVIGTRVSTGDECSIIITDGYGGTAEAAVGFDPGSQDRDEAGMEVFF
ncbi:MAG: AAA family ATPase [Coriobacteriia bacterium]|nr:AAA family ATPase [Coriobacteriia bacterium]